MVCLAPRALGDSVRPRRLSDVFVRPLNYTVRPARLTPLPTDSCTLTYTIRWSLGIPVGELATVMFIGTLRQRSRPWGLRT